MASKLAQYAIFSMSSIGHFIFAISTTYEGNLSHKQDNKMHSLHFLSCNIIIFSGKKKHHNTGKEGEIRLD